MKPRSVDFDDLVRALVLCALVGWFVLEGWTAWQ